MFFGGTLAHPALTVTEVKSGTGRKGPFFHKLAPDLNIGLLRIGSQYGSKLVPIDAKKQDCWTQVICRLGCR